MKVGIVGAGAMGSVVGSLLQEAGVETVLVERNKNEVRHVRENGLWIEGVSGERLLRPVIVSEPGEAREVDLALVMVKSYDTAAAVHTVKGIVSPQGLVLTLQNGIGNYEILSDAFPDRVLMGTTTIGAMTLGPGRFRHTGFGQTHLGEADGTIRERTREVASILEKMNAGPVHVVDNAVGCVWSKLLINAAINGPATLVRVKNGDLPSTQTGRALVHNIIEECLAVVRAKGIRLIVDDPEAQVLAVCEGTAGNINSMFQDVLARRRTEIDFINGAIAREGESLGLSVTVNRTLALLIGALEASAASRVPDL